MWAPHLEEPADEPRGEDRHSGWTRHGWGLATALVPGQKVGSTHILGGSGHAPLEGDSTRAVEQDSEVQELSWKQTVAVAVLLCAHMAPGDPDPERGPMLSWARPLPSPPGSSGAQCPCGPWPASPFSWRRWDRARRGSPRRRPSTHRSGLVGGLLPPSPRQPSALTLRLPQNTERVEQVKRLTVEREVPGSLPVPVRADSGVFPLACSEQTPLKAPTMAVFCSPPLTASGPLAE